MTINFSIKLSVILENYISRLDVKSVPLTNESNFKNPTKISESTFAQKFSSGRSRVFISGLF